MTLNSYSPRRADQAPAAGGRRSSTHSWRPADADGLVRVVGQPDEPGMAPAAAAAPRRRLTDAGHPAPDRDGVPLMDLVVRCLILFPLVVVLVRVVNRRELSSLEPFDVVLLVVIGDLLQQGITQSDYSVTGAAIVITTITLLSLVTAYLNWRIPAFRMTLEGEPIILLEHGRPIEQNLRGSGSRWPSWPRRHGRATSPRSTASATRCSRRPAGSASSPIDGRRADRDRNGRRPGHADRHGRRRCHAGRLPCRVLHPGQHAPTAHAGLPVGAERHLPPGAALAGAGRPTWCRPGAGIWPSSSGRRRPTTGRTSSGGARGRRGRPACRCWTRVRRGSPGRWCG